MSNSYTGIFINKLSDHQPCFTIIEISKPKKKKTTYIKIRVNTPEAQSNLKQDIKLKIENANFGNDLLQDPNDSYNTLGSIIREAMEKNLPIKEVKFNKYRHKITPWITNGILKAIKVRDKMYKKLKKTNPETQNYSDLETKYIEYCRLLKKSIRLAKSMYYSNQFEKYKLDIRKTWSQINQVIGKHQKGPKFPQYFLDKDMGQDCPKK